MLGAGSTSFTSIAYVLVADVCSPEARSTAFGYLLASTIVSRLIFVPVGGWMIEMGEVWTAMWIGFGVQVAGFAVAVFCVRETLPIAVDAGGSDSSQSTTLVGEEIDGSGTQEEMEGLTKPMTLAQRVDHYLEKAKEAGTWMLRNPKIVLLLLCFWLYMMGEQPEQLLMIQYASKRLGWSFGKVCLVLSLSHLFTTPFPLFSCPLPCPP